MRILDTVKGKVTGLSLVMLRKFFFNYAAIRKTFLLIVWYCKLCFLFAVPSDDLPFQDNVTFGSQVGLFS